MERLEIKLNPDDLNSYQRAFALIESIELAPANYRREEIESAYLARYRLIREFIDRYELLDVSSFQISQHDGSIWVGEDDD